MECNKDEAIRAKEIAEKKMQNNDFEGARRIALKAQQLFPELENISQLLAVCDVHCSGQNKIYGSEKDWYGILQVERKADEVTIKKQYRRLALVLHPDKNKFPGAEAAFKLIGEANMVLSDRVKRSLYDNKYNVSVRTTAPKPPPHQVNQNPCVRKPYGAPNNIPSVQNSNFGGLNHHRPAQPGSSNHRQAFWTCCPFCNIRYQYYRDLVNKTLRCQNCIKAFIAYDLGAPGVPPGSNCSQPAAFQQASNQGSWQSFSNRTVGSESVSRTAATAETGQGSKTKGKENGRMKTEGKKGGGVPSFVAEKYRESKTSRSTGRKRGRKLAEESGDSPDTPSSDDREAKVIQENVGNPAGQNSGVNGVHCPRRSSRKRHHVLYSEDISDNDDFVSRPKSSMRSRTSCNGEEKKEAVGDDVSRTDKSAHFAVGINKEDTKQNVSATPKGGFNRNIKGEKHKVDVEDAVTVDPNAVNSDVTDDSESTSNFSSSSVPEYFEFPDPEFSDFDKNKEENCFAVDQIWACYDTLDGMPRFYAWVRKVFSPGFKLRITWLEPHPEDICEIDWLSEGFPFACGKFTLGNSEETTDHLTFSHQVKCEKGSRRCSYVVYPRKGETWALFKDWDISWSSDPEKHRNYSFEIVEVLSDFVEDAGVRVGYLDKLDGFVSLFQRTARIAVLIPSSELLRFSHQVPSFRMTGMERAGVPEGSFELDPASLPSNLSEFCHPSNLKMETVGMDAKLNGPFPASPGNKVKSTRCPKSPEKKVESMVGSEKTNTPKKGMNFEGKNDLERETSKLRRSPRALNRISKYDQVNSSQCAAEVQNTKCVDPTKERPYIDLTASNGVGSSCQPIEQISLPKDTSPNSFFRKSFPCSSPVDRVSKEEFYNFSGDKSEGKFQLGQIWALYNSNDGLPRTYGQVKKIESSPFRLHVALLDNCTQPKDIVQPLSCGTFKLHSGKARFVPPSAFSHIVKVKSIGKDKFEIQPRVGEIWAIYKNWSADLTCSNQENGKYAIVEILEVNEHCIKVSSLVRLSGFKLIFKTPRRQRSSLGIAEIPWAELARFSHQIPAFRLTGEKKGALRDCWELDSASIPGNMFCSI